MTTTPDPDAPAKGNIAHEPSVDLAEDRSFRIMHNQNGTPHRAVAEIWNAERQSASCGGDGAEEVETLGLTPEGQAESVDPEIKDLRRENTELREIIAELKQHAEPNTPADKTLIERQKEYEALLEEKTDIIRDLHLKMQALQSQRPAMPAVQKEDDLLALSEELDRERCQLQQDRKQLEDERKQFMDDEQLMTKQMRDMEVQMARERADFARQRSELTRIYEEIRREMENIERNGLLNQRLGQLRQRLHESGAAVGAATKSGSAPAIPAVRPESAPPSQGRDSQPPKRRESFIGRLFG